MATLMNFQGIQALTPKPAPGGAGDAIDNNFRDMVQWSPKSNWTGTADPGAGDDKDDDYYPGSHWYNATSQRLFLCIDNTASAAVWHPLIPASGGKVVADPAGNTRGANSVDLQTTRTANTQVASGAGATVSGGNANTASGTNSFAAGETCTASGTATMALGSNVSASASFAHAIGRFSSATHNGELARASGTFATLGDAQSSHFVARNQTTNATQTELFLNGSNVQLTIPGNFTWGFTATIVARRTGTTVQSAMYTLVGAIRNNTGTGTAILGTVIKTVVFEDVAAWDVTAVADTTNNALSIKVTGEASKTINWVADVLIVQVGT